MAYRDEVRRRLDELEPQDDLVAETELARAAAEVDVEREAAVVAAARRAGALPLQAAVEARLADLAMPAARFAVEVGGPDPCDEVTFVLAANPGEPAAPLARAASGGELARVVLALRLVARVRRRRRSCSTRSTPASAVRPPGPSGARWPSWPPTGRCSSSPTCPRSPPSPITQVALVKEAVADGHRRAGARPRRRRRGGSSCRACSSGLPASGIGAASTPTSCWPPRRRSGADDRASVPPDRAPRADVVAGTARVGRRTKDLIKRLEPGDIAVIDHPDLDRVAADGLIEARRRRGRQRRRRRSPAATRTAARCGSSAAGIPLLDDVGSDVARRASPTAHESRIATARVLVGEVEVAIGHACSTRTRSEAAMEEARAGIGAELERFAVNTLEYIQHEARLTFEPLELPPLQHRVRAAATPSSSCGATTTRTTSRLLRPYIREYQPVLIGVDGGADALLEMRLTPDIIIGDFDSVSERGHGNCGAELVHHVHPDGRAPGPRGARTSGASTYEEFVVEGTSEDAAMLLAYEARRQAHRRRRHPRDDGRVPRQGPRRACRRRSSPGCASARCSSTPRA